METAAWPCWRRPPIFPRPCPLKNQSGNRIDCYFRSDRWCPTVCLALRLTTDFTLTSQLLLRSQSELILIHSGCMFWPLGCFRVIKPFTHFRLFSLRPGRMDNWKIKAFRIKECLWCAAYRTGSPLWLLQHGFSGKRSSNTKLKWVRNYWPCRWEQGRHSSSAKRSLFCSWWTEYKWGFPLDW